MNEINHNKENKNEATFVGGGRSHWNTKCFLACYGPSRQNYHSIIQGENIDIAIKKATYATRNEGLMIPSSVKEISRDEAENYVNTKEFLTWRY